jgi:toxin YoeB
VKLGFTPQGWADYLHWQDNDLAMLARINELIKHGLRNPFGGIGKPEPLRGNLKGWWSRRITQGHRLVYRVRGTGDEQVLEIAACRFHYDR